MQEKKVTRVEFPNKAMETDTTKSKKRVVAYARVSTMKDAQENSLDAQRDYFIRYIKKHPDWIFAGLYTDDGISSLSIRNRDGFNKMIADALDGGVDLILTKSLSRFARNTVDALLTIRKLKASGIAVYFEKEGINTMDSGGEFLITLMSSFAEEESRSISENVTWAVRRRYAKGIYSLPGMFLGYAKGANGEPIIDESEARIVRFIYFLALSGKSATHIAKILTDARIPTPNGKKDWQHIVVNSILTNEKYMGDAVLQKQFTVDFINKKSKKNRGEVPQYYVENGHLGIIARSAWEEVQTHFVTDNRKRCTYIPLANKIHCSSCGGLFSRYTWHSTTYHDTVWKCYNKVQGNTKCHSRHIYDTELKSAVAQSVNRLLAKYPEVLSDCQSILADIVGTVPDAILSALSDIRNGKSPLPIDELLPDILIVNISVGEKSMTFRMLDGSTQRYRLGKTPKRSNVVIENEMREKVLQMLRAGHTAREISEMLNMSINTVRSIKTRKNKSHFFAKTYLHNDINMV